jgi:hypothetical protein
MELCKDLDNITSFEVHPTAVANDIDSGDFATVSDRMEQHDEYAHLVLATMQQRGQERALALKGEERAAYVENTDKQIDILHKEWLLTRKPKYAGLGEQKMCTCGTNHWKLKVPEEVESEIEKINQLHISAPARLDEEFASAVTSTIRS